ncbi:Holliday junction resolvase RuvX [Candidatus Shapirobacteria bacterium CG09_land_8_20_14_0_10_49_15]|uniref:Putative pre-16S rRNA nuclease n=1 Tax=Candidatus Shapirobacteria bacterium CG09_land_8_20_14_0_10_49_15 TaxID=1974482 RepID=A0A2M6XAR0_9BACT|nr:MAG: Holliday junction resolvase RuvX [Candidatus Shapirobacteria bacterium CG09_land_8_20_14_0_10_49_15]
MILGIDFGLKRIGLALADQDLVEPFKVVNNSSAGFKKLVEICRQYQISQIVVGLPEGRLVPAVKQFAQKLKRAAGLPVAFQDESLTTQDALAKMIMSGKKQQARRQTDTVAAALILENYLQRTNNV